MNNHVSDKAPLRWLDTYRNYYGLIYKIPIIDSPLRSKENAIFEIPANASGTRVSKLITIASYPPT